MTGKSDTVYLIQPRLGGFANDTTIGAQGGETLYHVTSKIFSPTGRQYGVYDNNMAELLRTEQEHSVFFPRHLLLQKDHCLGKVGQVGIIPQTYFVELPRMPRAQAHIGGASPIFELRGADYVVAEIAQHLSTWIVVIPKADDHFLVLSAIAIIYRENTIGG